MVISANCAFRPLEQVAEIFVLTAITYLITRNKFGIKRYLNDSCPMHGMTVSRATGVDTGFAGERGAGWAPVMPKLVRNC